MTKAGKGCYAVPQTRHQQDINRELFGFLAFWCMPRRIVGMHV
jgi:hypothetical protein